ncbi:MAG: sigma-70 family RNA polymerase sigma factor [Anaerolineae bacterium]|nr:sigma-70 family RNA polymerase sigma factor [Anaerolineae bacterium]
MAGERDRKDTESTKRMEERSPVEPPETVLERYRDRLYGFVRRELRYYESLELLQPDEVSAMDIVDDVLARALQLWDRRPENLMPWLYRLALHRLRQVLRAARERPDKTICLELPAPLYESPEELDREWWEFYQPDDVVTWEDIVPDERIEPPEELESQLEAMHQVERLLNQLPARPREVFVLATFEDLTPEEIAGMLNVSVEQVQSWLRDARARLRRALTEHVGQGTKVSA